MKTELNHNEKLVKKGGANLQKGVETVGGYLYLTNQRLIFEAHAINIQGGNTIIYQILSQLKMLTKFKCHTSYAKLTAVNTKLAMNIVLCCLDEVCKEKLKKNLSYNLKEHN